VDEAAIPSDQQAPELRDHRGRWKPGTPPPRGSRPFQKGQTGNPEGRKTRITRRLEELLSGSAPLTPELQEVLAKSGADPDDIPMALVSVVIWIALDTSNSPMERLAAVKFLADRIDGPVKTAIDVRTEGCFKREVVIVSVPPGPPPPWPEEVLAIERAESRAAAAHSERLESLGAGRSSASSSDGHRDGDAGPPAAWSAARPRRRTQG